MVKKKKVVWDELARTALREAYNRIKRDSLKQAEKVKQEILDASKKLADHLRCIHRTNIERTKIIASVLLKNIAIGYPTSLPKIPSGCYGSVM